MDTLIEALKEKEISFEVKDHPITLEMKEATAKGFVSKLPTLVEDVVVIDDIEIIKGYITRDQYELFGGRFKGERYADIDAVLTALRTASIKVL